MYTSFVFCSVKKPPEEADQAKDEDMQVLIDNRSVIGSAILNRVRRCPSDHCQKIECLSFALNYDS